LTDNDSEDDMQGTIRQVPGARLISKRQSDDGTFTELWLFLSDVGFKSTDAIRTEILKGTDIKPGYTASEDGSQRYELWSCGNIQMLEISGLND